MLTLQSFFNSLTIDIPSAILEQLKSHKFNYSKTEYALDEIARGRVLNYIQNTSLLLESYGSLDQANSLIAFSFGDSESVNLQLAQEVDAIRAANPHIGVFAQQEIAYHIQSDGVTKIESSQYQTTADVARSLNLDTDNHGVVVVAQAWHALRCVETCESMGINVVALRVVDSFPQQDPQPWVRNPINWIIKESHREIATGYEISELYGLV